MEGVIHDNEKTADAADKQIQVILGVKDMNPIASLHDYRRIVIDVSKSLCSGEISV